MSEVEMASKRDEIDTKLLRDTLDLFVIERNDGSKFTYNAPTYNKLLEMLAVRPIYRLEFNDNHTIAVDTYDLIENFEPELKPWYDASKDLPEWAQEKLAVLMVLDPAKPIDEVEGVGRRINKRVFWIYPNGYDTGSESQS